MEEFMEEAVPVGGADGACVCDGGRGGGGSRASMAG